MTAETATIRAVATAQTCEARTGQRAGEFHEEPIWCNAQRGLRSFLDANGTRRWYCPALHHKDTVARRYGVQARWALDAGEAVLDAPEDWETRKARYDAEMRADLELMADEFHGRGLE